MVMASMTPASGAIIFWMSMTQSTVYARAAGVPSRARCHSLVLTWNGR